MSTEENIKDFKILVSLTKDQVDEKIVIETLSNILLNSLNKNSQEKNIELKDTSSKKNQK